MKIPTEQLALLFERQNAALTFWNMYYTITLAFLAFGATTQTENYGVITIILLVCAYLAFSIINLRAVLIVLAQRHTIIKCIRESAGSESLSDCLHAPSRSMVTLGRLFGDIVVIAAFTWITK